MLAADEWCVRGGMTVFISPPPPWLNKENGNQLALHLFWEIFSRERICLSKVRAGVTVAYQRHSTKARTHIRYDAKEQLFCFHLRPYKHTENSLQRNPASVSLLVSKLVLLLFTQRGLLRSWWCWCWRNIPNNSFTLSWIFIYPKMKVWDFFLCTFKAQHHLFCALMPVFSCLLQHITQEVSLCSFFTTQQSCDDAVSEY